jgi:hypothetical protein
MKSEEHDHLAWLLILAALSVMIYLSVDDRVWKQILSQLLKNAHST